MLNKVSPQNGSLLLSEPFMAAPHFKRAVIFITDHDEEGTIGYVLNHKSNLLVKNVLTDCEDATFPVYEGGPVGNDTLHFIHRCYDKMNSGTHVGGDIYWGGNYETLKFLINNQMVSEEEVKFFVGYSGWADDQLSIELEQNSWIVSNEYDPRILFLDNEEDLWKEMVIGLGPKYAHMVNFPENPLWN